MRVWTCPADSSARADRADAAVHHVGRRDDVGAGLGVRDGLLDERLDGLVVDDVAGIVDQPVLAVRRERIERDVGDDAELRIRFLERAHGTLREAFGIPGLARVEALRLGRRHREQRERRDAERVRLAGDAHELVDRKPVDARHRWHRLANRAAFADEDRQDQVGRREIGLAHQRAREGIAAHAARPDMRIGHRKVAGNSGCALYAPRSGAARR